MSLRLKYWSYRLLAPRALYKEKYQALQNLLEHDSKAHEEMALLQQAMLAASEDISKIRIRLDRFSAEVKAMAKAINALHPGPYSALVKYHKKFDFYARLLLAPPAYNAKAPYILDFSEITEKTSAVCGKKAANASFMAKELAAVLIPPGFVITCNAFFALFSENQREVITQLLQQIDLTDEKKLHDISREIQEIILNSSLPGVINTLLTDRLKEFEGPFAVRSSALGEDDIFSFAGQYESILHVEAANIADAWLKVIASKYSPAALSYRIRNGFDDYECAMAVLVQQMVESEISGVLYTGQKFQLNTILGEGEKLVSGEQQAEQLFLLPDGTLLDNTPQLITQEAAATLARIGAKIEALFQTPQDIEWAIDATDKLYILQARPLHNMERGEKLEESIEIKLPLLHQGKGLAGRVGSGKIFHLHNSKDMVELATVPDGSIVISKTSPPELTTILYRISGVICEQGAVASHLATIARELGIPLLLADNAFHIKDGIEVTIDCNSGGIYEGITEVPVHNQQAPKRYLDALQHITPLSLTNPGSKDFKVSNCRSLHDIIRFSHEKALQAIFEESSPASSRQSLRLASDIPLDIFLFDIGGAIRGRHGGSRKVPLKAVQSLPFHAIWKGLSHPDVKWVQKPFDWDAYHRIEMSGATPPPQDSIAFASYAAISPDYAHFNLRFGYHFTIVNTRCSLKRSKNYCLIRFAGGGSDDYQLALRVHFLAEVLERLGFSTTRKGNYLEARVEGVGKKELLKQLESLGHLLGASKLMDMILKDEAMAVDCVDQFFNGRYDFQQS